MKITANTKAVQLIDAEEFLSGAYNDITIDVELSEEYKGLTSFVTFNDEKTPVIAGKVSTPCLFEGLCRIGVYAVDIDDDSNVVLRYSPKPVDVLIKAGTWNNRIAESDAPTTSEAEKIYILIDNAIAAGQLKGDKGDKGNKGDPGRQGPQGIKGDPGESGLVELKAGSQRNIKNLDNHLYYTAGNVRLKTLNNAEMYLDLPQGTFLLVEKETDNYGNIELKATIWGSCTFDNIEYKYGIHQYKYNTIGGFIKNSFVLDTKSIETAIANLEANKQDSLTAGAGITITENGVISSDVGLKIIVLKDGEDLPNEGTPPKNTIYFKRNTETDNESVDWYEEYIWVNDWWELIGTTKVDLSAKQDKLTVEQLENISAIPNKIDQSQVGNGLKFADGVLSLDIPVATVSTTYGGEG